MPKDPKSDSVLLLFCQQTLRQKHVASKVFNRHPFMRGFKRGIAGANECKQSQMTSSGAGDYFIGGENKEAIDW